MQGITKSYLKVRYWLFKWRCSLAFADKAALAFGMACATGVAAQIKIYLPFTPVPITAQTLTVLLAGVILGRWWGGISQAIYIAVGALGIPWFASCKGGYSALFGPTGGYLIGFIAAALFIGHFIDKYIGVRRFLPMFGIMLFANFVLIHGFGLLQLGLWFYIVKATKLTFGELLRMGTVPFIVGDIVKIIVAAMLAKTLIPKRVLQR